MTSWFIARNMELSELSSIPPPHLSQSLKWLDEWGASISFIVLFGAPRTGPPLICILLLLLKYLYLIRWMFYSLCVPHLCGSLMSWTLNISFACFSLLLKGWSPSHKTLEVLHKQSFCVLEVQAFNFKQVSFHHPVYVSSSHIFLIGV